MSYQDIAGELKIIGLGSGTKEELTFRAYQELLSVDQLFLRSSSYPLVTTLHKEGIEFSSCERLIGSDVNLDQITNQLIDQIRQALATGAEVGYATLGSPVVEDKIINELIDYLPQQQIEIVEGISIAKRLQKGLDIAVGQSLHIIDSLNCQAEQLTASQGVVITNLHAALLDQLQSELFAIYPRDYQLQVIEPAGFAEIEVVEELTVAKLDKLATINSLTSLYLPPLNYRLEVQENELDQLTTLVDIISQLRSPEGCPWDRKQTHQSLRPYLIEETYEVLERIDQQDMTGLCEELGDLLLQVVLHSQLAAEEDYFSIGDVIAAIAQKMIRRHPHVFGDESLSTAREVREVWQRVKSDEKQNENQSFSVLDDVSSLPALLEAEKIQSQAAEVGFDWATIDGAVEKLAEELSELEEVLAEDDLTEVREELGDLLFAVVNVGRWLDFNLEMVLHDATVKFKERFYYLEERVKAEDKKLAQLTIEQLEELWQEAKRNL
ncbi:MAG: nucleoside triphosphate pyrophosphohydrolase [Bacillota bacterium]